MILKRLTFVLLPVWVVGIPVTFVLSPVVWVLTGTEPSDAVEWWADTMLAHVNEWATR